MAKIKPKVPLQKVPSAQSKKTVKVNVIPEENKYYIYALILAFTTLVFFAASYKISGDDDFFWHLATGRYIVQNQVVPNTDIFGYATAGVEWIPFEWGWDVITYGLYNIGGYNAILLFRSIIFSLIFFIYYLLLKKFKVNSVISYILFFILLIAIMDRLSPRPHILTYLFFVILLYIITSFKYIDREKYFKWLYFLPLIFLIWGNVHMGVLAGGLLLFIYTVSEVLIFLYPQRFSSPEIKPLTREQIQRLLLISVASALVLLINPHGLQTYLYAYGHTKMKLLETINEWRNPFSGGMDFGFIVTFYKILLFSGIIILIYSIKKKDIFFALTYIGFAIYSVRAIRLTVDYEIIIIFFLAVSINYYFQKWANTGKGNNILQFFLYNNGVKAVLIALFVYITFNIPNEGVYQWLKYYRIPGFGVNSDFIPVQLFDFMKEANISGKPFNHFGTGGYLVWNFPNEKNFIDSRNLNDAIFNEYNTIMVKGRGFEKKLDDYGVDYVVFLDPDLIRRPKDLQTNIVSYVSRNPGWKLVFWDDKSFLFVKDIPKFADVINKYEYRILNPYNFIFHQQEFDKKMKEDPERAKQELDRKIKTEPRGYILSGIHQFSQKYFK
ncbi:MAG: hypothetical protein EHM58_03975 [Ignavibacteriae bacterium]|nr:MAG: hypothetical protein EHM58_03975 [Ignavibacteriota bacterium]